MKFLENSLEKLARILSRQYQVEVLFEGQQAFTDGRKVVLPYFEEITEELELDLNGYLDHEVSHIKFTTFEEVKHIINAYHKQLLNAVEDVRIERLMIQEFPGTKYHLDSLNDKLISKLRTDWFSRPWSIRFLLAVSFKMDNRPMEKDPEVEYYLDLCKEEIAKLNSCNSTKELRIVTESMVKKLIKDLKDEDKKEEKKDEKQKGEQGEGEEGDDSDSQDSDESGEGQSSKDGKDKESKDGKDGKDSKGDKKEEKESKGKESDKGEKSDKSKSDKSGKPKKGQPSKSSGDSLVTEKDDKKFDQFEIDVHRMIEKMIEKKIEEENKNVEKAKYNYNYEKGNKTISVPYTTKYDRVHELSGKNYNNSYSGVRQKVKPLVNTLKMNLERIFKSVENARWKSEREQGLVNARSLANLASNPNYRGVFKEMVKTETDKVAISILVDLSGSMCGDKVETAKLASTAMSEALKGLGINFEVLGFNTGYSNELNTYVGRAKSENLTRFNRLGETLEHFVFKDFNSDSLLGLSNMKSAGANADGESVMWAAKRLSLRSEKRKILIVMSDGMPSCGGDHRILQSDLRAKLAQIEKFGIETVGIGIQTDAVKHFYKDYLVINNLKDLTTTSLKKLEAILLKGLKK